MIWLLKTTPISGVVFVFMEEINIFETGVLKLLSPTDFQKIPRRITMLKSEWIYMGFYFLWKTLYLNPTLIYS
ncbi:protein of unknown function [Xenorhabdus doucetiae]|uniref:Uncharacterized protein n=1 Tax=Xenorhabdus doucetiae TaxID=351671 RepID=A0A068QPE2_9GAMM|nr:protein of unknown function [Xenorhabdus doucetiae]